MRCKLLFPVLLALFAAAPVRAQAPKDPATLMPAKVLAYAEIREAGDLAREIGKLFKGSALSDVPDSLTKMQAKFAKKGRIQDRFLQQGLGAAGLFLAPEVIAELGRVQGGAVAFTGLGDNQQPKFLAVVLPGDSNAPGFFMRMAMTMAPMKKVETVEGVTIHGLAFERDGLPVFARTSSALLVGDLDNVKDAILRLKGKFDGPSLADNKTFQVVRKQTGAKPGLLSYSELAPLLKLTDNLPLGRGDKEVFRIIEKVVNPKAFRVAAKRWSLEDGTLSTRALMLLDPAEKCPILDVLPTKAVDLDLLHFAPKDSIFAAAIDNSGGEKRFASLVSLIDDNIPPQGMLKFSDVIKGLETKIGAEFGKDILGQITAAGVAVGDPLKMKVKIVEEIGPNFTSRHTESEVPVVIIVRAKNPEAAEKLMKLVPALFALGRNRELAEPTTKKIEGREITVLKLDKYSEAFYGRQGSTIVLGPFGPPVAKSLNSGAKRQGLLSDPQTAERLKAMENKQVIACVKLSAVVASTLMVRNSATGRFEAEARPINKDAKDDDPKKDDPKKEEPKKSQIKITYRSAMDEPMAKELSKILSQEEFFVIGLERTKGKIQIDGQVTGLQRLIPRLVDFGIEAAYINVVGDRPGRPADREKEKRFDRKKDFDK